MKMNIKKKLKGAFIFFLGMGFGWIVFSIHLAEQNIGSSDNFDENRDPITLNFTNIPPTQAIAIFQQKINEVGVRNFKIIYPPYKNPAFTDGENLTARFDNCVCTDLLYIFEQVFEREAFFNAKKNIVILLPTNEFGVIESVFSNGTIHVDTQTPSFSAHSTDSTTATP